MSVETMLTWFDSTIDWWGTVLLHSLWIATLAAIVVIFVCNARIVKSTDARYVIVLLALLSIPFGSIAAVSFSGATSSGNVATELAPEATHSVSALIPDSIPDSNSAPLTSPSVTPWNPAQSSAESKIDSQLDSRRLLTALWGIGVAIMLMRIVCSHFAANRLTYSVTAVPADWLDKLFCRLKQSVGRVSHASLRTTEAIAVPMVYGVIRPVVLLPVSVVSGLPEESLKVILAHELAHVRRGDLWFSLVERLIEAFFFFHPAVWWLLRVIQTEREVCCDAIAADVVGQPLDVAAALVNSAATISSVRSSESIGNVALAAGGGDLEERVERLIDPGKSRKLGFTVASLILLSGIGLLGILFLTVSTASVAAQVQRALSPQEQVAAVAEAIQSATPEQSDFVLTDEAVSGRVMLPDGSDNLPLRKQISLVYESGKSSGSIGITVDKDGAFTATVPAPAVVHVLMRSEGFAPSVFGPFDLGNAPLDLGNLTLSKGFSSRLKLVDRSGAAIEGAIVESASVEINDTVLGAAMGIRGQSTDAAGALSIDHCTDVAIRIQVRKPGFEVDRKTLRWKPDQTIEWQLRRTAPATGQILDESGQPVVGVDVYLYQQTKPFNTWFSPRERFLETYGRPREAGLARTDSEGKFQLTSLRSDSEYTFMALADNRQPLLVYDAKPGAELKSLVMKSSIQVSGRIKGDLTKLWQPPWNKNRVFSFTNPVRLRDGSSRMSSGLYVPVQPDGTFTLPQLVPGNVSLFLDQRDYHIDTSKPRTDLEFDLDAEVQSSKDLLRPVEIEFQAADARLLRGTILLSWQMPEGSRGDFPSHKQDGFRLNDPRDKNGTSYAKVKNRPLMKVSLVDGNIIHWAAPPGAKIWLQGDDLVGAIVKSAWYSAVPDGKQPHRIAVPFQPAGAVTGRFVDSDGQPIKKFQLHIRGQLDGGRLPFSKFETIEHADGRFVMGPLPLNTQHEYTAYLSDQNTWQAAVFGPFRITDSAPVVAVHVKLPPPITLRGIVVGTDGSPLPDSVISLTINTRGKKSSSHQLAHSVGTACRTDNEGRFAVKATPVPIDATIRLYIHPKTGHCNHEIEFPSSAFPNDGDLGIIKLRPTSKLTGRVVDETGEPIESVALELNLPDPNGLLKGTQAAWTNASGDFEFLRVEHKRVELHSLTHEILSVTKPFVLAPSSENDGIAQWQYLGTSDTHVSIVVRKK